MKNVSRLIRWPNILMIALTMYAMRYAVLLPIFGKINISPVVTHIDFFILVITMMAITAGGYVINDYFDTRADMINRPAKVLVGKHIDRRKVIMLHWMLNIIAVVAGGYVTYSIGKPYLVILFIVEITVLWFYSSYFKQKLFIGNLLVAILTGSVPFLVWMVDMWAIYPEKSFISWFVTKPSHYLYYWIFVYTFFAFALTLIREIIKDAEDVKGDIEFGRKTIPIVFGMKKTKALVVTLTSLVLVMLAFLFNKATFEGYFSPIYLLVLLILPIIYLINSVLKAKERSDFSKSSLLSKVIMLFGVLYSFVFYYYTVL